MNARELAKQIEQLLNDKVEGAEAYATSGGEDSRTATIQVAFDDEDQLFRIVVQEENG